MATVQNVQNNQVNSPQNSHYMPQGHDANASNSDHIIKKTPFIGGRILADKLVNDIFVYAPKGLSGSRNSNFYEFLSLGLVPNIVGSAMLIALFNAANKSFRAPDSHFASRVGRKMGAGVILYAAGKWLGGKLINKGVQAYTGVDLEMPYVKKAYELPDKPGEKPKVATEYHRVFESAEFPRTDLLYKYGEERGNRYLWYDKIAKKMNFKDKLNSPDQTVNPKVKEIIVKSTAAKYISSYVWAALGVALAAQAPFESKFTKGYVSMKQKAKALPINLASTLKKSFSDLYTGQGRNFTHGSKYVGKALIFGALASTILGIYNTCRGFKIGKNEPDTQINTDKKYEVL